MAKNDLEFIFRQIIKGKYFKWHYEHVFVNYKLFEGINACKSNSKSENSMAHINTG